MKEWLPYGAALGSRNQARWVRADRLRDGERARVFTADYLRGRLPTGPRGYRLEAARPALSQWYRATCPSRKGRGNSFPVTVGALVGACFPPILGWCRHYGSHFLRALGTKQCPGVNKNCLVQHMIMHRHDDFPLVGKTTRGLSLRSVAESCLYEIAHCSAIFRDLLKQK
jgi:hypothetical protein